MVTESRWLCKLCFAQDRVAVTNYSGIVEHLDEVHGGDGLNPFIHAYPVHNGKAPDGTQLEAPDGV